MKQKYTCTERIKPYRQDPVVATLIDSQLTWFNTGLVNSFGNADHVPSYAQKLVFDFFHGYYRTRASRLERSLASAEGAEREALQQEYEEAQRRANKYRHTRARQEKSFTTGWYLLKENLTRLGAPWTAQVLIIADTLARGEYYQPYDELHEITRESVFERARKILARLHPDITDGTYYP